MEEKDDKLNSTIKEIKVNLEPTGQMERWGAMDRMLLVILLVVINSYIITETKKHPGKWENEKYDKKFKTRWTIFSIAFIVAMLFVVCYIFFISSADTFSKIFYLLSIAMLVGFFAFQTFSLWKNKK